MRARRRLLAALAGLTCAALTLSGCGFTGLYDAPLPGGADLGDHPYTLTAYFSDVLDLVPQSAVKVDDTPVGKVTKIALAECRNPAGGTTTLWCAKVTLEVRGSVHLPLRTTTASVQQTSLLGEKYVALDNPDKANPQGTVACPCLGNGDEVGRYARGGVLASSTSAPEAEDVLGALSLVLNKGGLDQIQVIAQEVNKALDSPARQTAVRDLITQLSTFTGTLDAQKDTITSSLANLDVLVKTLNNQKTLLEESLDTFPAALKVLSDERSKLVKLLTSLSSLGAVATRVINASQTDLVSALKALDPVVVKLAQTGSNLPKALRIAGTFPFPLGLSRQFVRGDYANLDAYVRVDLGDLLCTLSSSLCNVLPSSAKSTKVTVQTPMPSTLTPVLLGSGG